MCFRGPCPKIGHFNGQRGVCSYFYLLLKAPCSEVADNFGEVFMLIPSLLFFGMVFIGFVVTSKLKRILIFQKSSVKEDLFVASSFSVFVTVGVYVALYTANVGKEALLWLVFLHGLLFFAVFYGMLRFLRYRKRK